MERSYGDLQDKNRILSDQKVEFEVKCTEHLSVIERQVFHVHALNLHCYSYFSSIFTLGTWAKEPMGWLVEI